MPRPPFDHFRFVAPLFDRMDRSENSQADLAVRMALPINGWLLDAGGGTGRISKTLHHQTGGVVVLDVSHGMLKRARDKNGLRPAHAQVESLPFPDDYFERILIVDAFHHFFHHEAATQELWRVLKPGGLLFIEEPNIARWQIKLVALGEKLLLMRSRFFYAEELDRMFAAQKQSRVTVDTDSNPFYIQLIAEKRI